MTTIKTSTIARNLGLKGQQALCEFIRKNIAPEINYTEWLQIEKDITEVKKNVNQYLTQGLMTSLGKDENLPPEIKEIFKSEIPRLDNAVRDQMKKIDLKKLKDLIPKKEMKKLNNLFDMVLKEVSDYEAKK